MRGYVFTLQDFEQLHFHGVAYRIADGSLRGDCQNDWVVNLRGSLLECANHIFSNVSREPFINCANLRAQALEFIDRHGADFKQGARQEVFNTLLRSNQLLAVSPRTGCILKGSLGEELVQRTSGTGDSGPEWTHHLFCLLHGRSRSDLMSRCCVNHHEVVLD